MADVVHAEDSLDAVFAEDPLLEPGTAGDVASVRAVADFPERSRTRPPTVTGNHRSGTSVGFAGPSGNRCRVAWSGDNDGVAGGAGTYGVLSGLYTSASTVSGSFGSLV
jgi:hypothetical protein